jgi:hypothetical protein
MDQAIMPNNELTSTDKSLSLEINKDRLKHFFYMLHGEPTTRSRPFDGAILVSKSDVTTLVKELIEQLELVKVKEYTISIGVGFDKDFVEKPFSEFVRSEWNDPEKTKEITIKVNFLFEEYETENPLKHSVFIRIAKDMKKGNILQLLASNDSDNLDNLENLMCPVFCRTDHINDKLSKDIMRVVEDWHSGQKQPRILSGGYEFLKNNKTIVARIIHYSIPAAVVFILAYFAFSIPDLLLEKNHLPAYASLIIASNLLLTFFLRLSGTRASKAFRNLAEISADDVIFDITKGDNKEQSDAINKNKDLFKGSRSIFIWTNGQAITASLIAAGIIEFLKA